MSSRMGRIWRGTSCCFVTLVLGCRPDSRPADNVPAHGSVVAAPIRDTTQARPIEPSAYVGVLVTESQVGTIPLDSSLGYLVSHFPDHTVDTTIEAEAPGPSVTFRFEGVSATAFVASLEDSSRTALAWMIGGLGILLRDSVRMPDNWQEFRARFRGQATLSIDEMGAHVELCELPGLTFYLDFAYDAESMDTLSLASVPATAAIQQIGIHKMGMSSGPCGSP